MTCNIRNPTVKGVMFFKKTKLTLQHKKEPGRCLDRNNHFRIKSEAAYKI